MKHFDGSQMVNAPEQMSMEKEVMRTEAPSFHFLTCSILGLLGLVLFSGVFLSVYYTPTFALAFSSVQRLSGEIPFGWIARRLHAAGGSLLLLLLTLHLFSVFYAGSYKRRPRPAWVLEVLMLVSLIWANFTGFFLPLSQNGFWGTAVFLTTISTIPWVGGIIVEYLRGGKELGGIALIRFYSMHIGFSTLMGLLLFGYYRMELAERQSNENGPSSRDFWTAVIVAILLLGSVTFVPYWFTDPLKEAANPIANPERVSLPWYLLFTTETLPLFNTSYPLWAFILLSATLFLLILLPYIDRRGEKNLLLRPFAMALSSAFLIAIVYFSLLGTANARYGEKVILPDRALTSAEIRGAQVFAKKNCAYCHQVFGREGRRQGPDLSVVTRRRRSRDWIQRFIFNARLYQPGTAMPRYEIPLEDLEALSAYLLSLDPHQGDFKTINRNDLLGEGRTLEVQGEGKR